MPVSKPPRDFEDWRRDDYDRAEDAAYAFGFHLITHCRDEALACIDDDATADTRTAVTVLPQLDVEL